MKESKATAVAAAIRFCESRGMEILATNWASPSGVGIDIVGKEGDGICFISVTVAERSEGFSKEAIDRETWEAAAASWLSQFGPDEGGVSIRFDRCDMIVLDDERTRAFLRYHSGVLSDILPEDR